MIKARSSSGRAAQSAGSIASTRFHAPPGPESEVHPCGSFGFNRPTFIHHVKKLGYFSSELGIQSTERPATLMRPSNGGSNICPASLSRSIFSSNGSDFKIDLTFRYALVAERPVNSERMAYRTSTTLRVCRNIIDGNEYAGSIVAVKKQFRLDVAKDDKAYLLLHNMELQIQYEVAILSSSLSPAVETFNPVCILLIHDLLEPFSPGTLAHFVDQVLERSDLKKFGTDALNETLSDFHVSRTFLIPSFQLMLGRKVQFVLFIRGD